MKAERRVLEMFFNLHDFLICLGEKSKFKSRLDRRTTSLTKEDRVREYHRTNYERSADNNASDIAALKLR